MSGSGIAATDRASARCRDRTLSGSETKDRVPVHERVGGTDRPGQPIVSRLCQPTRLGPGQIDIGGDDPDRGVQRGRDGVVLSVSNGASIDAGGAPKPG